MWIGVNCSDNCCNPRRARWGGPAGWGFEGFGDLWGAKGGPRRSRHGGRMFEQGDLKLVVLRLLEEKPRHGYEIIKELEGRLGGAYSPSPGTVYPTLTLLEDMGFARVVPEEGGKKIYEITDEGRKHLAEHSTTVNDIFDRISRFVEGFVDAPMREVNLSFKNVARATYSTATGHIADRDLLTKIKEVLDRASVEIDQLAKKTP
jgi:DNA-binding PadR family transcriptional regulator